MPSCFLELQRDILCSTFLLDKNATGCRLGFFYVLNSFLTCRVSVFKHNKKIRYSKSCIEMLLSIIVISKRKTNNTELAFHLD